MSIFGGHVRPPKLPNKSGLRGRIGCRVLPRKTDANGSFITPRPFKGMKRKHRLRLVRKMKRAPMRGFRVPGIYGSADAGA